MKSSHLDEERLMLALLGEEHEETKTHLAECEFCRGELTSWRRMEEASKRWTPSFWRRWRVRQMVLWRLRPGLLWPVLVPASIMAAVLLTGVVLTKKAQPPADVAAVLEEVDATLASDPLWAFGDPELVEMIAPEAISGERSEI